MINYVFVAEFDILKGCMIRASYPEINFNDTVLSSYMIPDGSHKLEWDTTYFRTILSPKIINQNNTSNTNNIIKQN